MKIKISKLGQIYDPSLKSSHPKLATHASNPVPVLISGDTYRIFFNARDFANRSSVGAIDFNLADLEVLTVYDKPFITYGEKETFFSEGISLGNFFKFKNKKFLSFMGWKTYDDKSWRGEIGILTLKNDFSVDKIYDEPIIKIDKKFDPISMSYPWMMEVSHEHLFAWYGSTIGYDKKNHEMIHKIHGAYSENVMTWKKLGKVTIDSHKLYQMYSRPCVVMDETGKYELWFSAKSGPTNSYRIEYAKSSDAKNWKLSNTPIDLTVSEKGWDSEMIEYPYVFWHKEKKYLLYNGNDYGKTGFGIAEIIHE